MRDLLTLHTWSLSQAKRSDVPVGERRLWRQIAREVEAYERGTVTTTPAGAPLCQVCRESGGRHRSLASGRYVSGHDASEGLLW